MTEPHKNPASHAQAQASFPDGRPLYMSQVIAGGVKLILCDYGDRTQCLGLASSGLFMHLFPGLILFDVL